MFFLVAFPSASIVELPQAPGIVPSSINVTLVVAICFPKSSEKTDKCGATAVASKPCPQASWNITAPNPGAITTGNSPPLKSTASSFSTAVLETFNVSFSMS